MIVLKLIYTIVGIFLFIFLESFFSNLLGINIAFVFFLFLYRKVDWKILFPLMFIICLIIDVTSHYMLGTNFLTALLALIFFSLVSIFFSTEVGILSWGVKFFTLLVYYILFSMLPSLFLNRAFTLVTSAELKNCVLYSAISLIITILSK